MEQPFFAKESDIDVNAIERAKNSDRIGSIFEHARRPYGIRSFVELRERRGLFEVLKLFVLQAGTGKFFLAPVQRRSEPRANTVDGIHRARIVDIVGGNKRGI